MLSLNVKEFSLITNEKLHADECCLWKLHFHLAKFTQFRVSSHLQIMNIVGWGRKVRAYEFYFVRFRQFSDRRIKNASRLTSNLYEFLQPPTAFSTRNKEVDSYYLKARCSIIIANCADLFSLTWTFLWKRLLNIK